MSLGAATLEGLALDALENGDEELARGLVEQMTPEEAGILRKAAFELGGMAGRVETEPLRRRHLRVVS